MEALDANEVSTYVNGIMGKREYQFWKPKCQTPIAIRYDSLKSASESREIQYYFTLDLCQAKPMLPSLLGAIIQTIRFLGPQQCALSIVEGRSTDGTYQVLAALKTDLEKLGTIFHLSTSNISPKNKTQDRREGLAFLRNLALAPLVAEPHKYSPDTQVIILNDIHLCPHDILELIFQQRMENATMTCGMDWSEDGSIFYDIYVACSWSGRGSHRVWWSACGVS